MTERASTERASFQPMIGRQSIIDAVLDQLQRPDDVRDDPQHKVFAQPGFYGLGGIGKSRLLHEIEIQARRITPYVCYIDFDPRSQVYAPGTVTEFLRILAGNLETLDRDARRFWQRDNPFKDFSNVAARIALPESVSQSITIEHGQGQNITQVLSFEGFDQLVASSHIDALADALANLHHKAATHRELGLRGKSRPRPLVVVLLDSVDAATRPLRNFLPNLNRLFGARQTLDFYVMWIAGGRQMIPHLTSNPLPPLTTKEAETLVRQYITYRYAGSPTRENPATKNHLKTKGRSGGAKGPGSPFPPDLASLLRNAALLQEIVAHGEGIPLLLQMLADITMIDPNAIRTVTVQFRRDPDVYFRYTMQCYLSRLRALADLRQDESLWSTYFLLLCGSAARRVPNSTFLRILLLDLPGTPFDTKTNYESLFQQLGHEAYVQRAVDGSLLLHDLVREEVSRYLKAQDEVTWKNLHQRAASCFEQSDRTEYLFHLLCCDSRRAIPELKERIEDALARDDFKGAQALMEVMKSVDLLAEDAAWITLYKADLAWGEHNRSLALERLRSIYPRPEVGDQIALRLERWLGFDPNMETLVVSGGETQIPAEFRDDFEYWLDWRNLHVLKFYSLLDLAESSLHKDQPPAEAGTLHDMLSKITARNCPHLLSRATRLLGEIAVRSGQFADARRFAAQSREFCRPLGYDHNWSAATMLMARASLFERGPEELQSFLTNMQKEAYSHGCQEGDACAQAGLGLLAFTSRGPDAFSTAKDHLRSALDLFSAAKHPRGKAWTFHLLAEIVFREDPGYESLDLYEQAHAEYELVGDLQGQAQTLSMMAMLAGANFYRELDGHAGGLSWLDRGGVPRAIVMLRPALDLYKGLQDKQNIAHTHLLLGPALFTEHRSSEGLSMVQSALSFYSRAAHVRGQVSALLVLGQMALMEPDFDKAQASLTRALRLSIASALKEEQMVKHFADLAMSKTRLHLSDPIKLAFVAFSQVVDSAGIGPLYRREVDYGLQIVESSETFSRRAGRW